MSGRNRPGGGTGPGEVLEVPLAVEVPVGWKECWAALALALLKSRSRCDIMMLAVAKGSLPVMQWPVPLALPVWLWVS
jgi:hypothetical protein